MGDEETSGGKPGYEAPRLTRLTPPASALAVCGNGSTPGGDCYSGFTAADGACTSTGGTANGECSYGDRPVGSCFDGGSLS